MPSGAKKRKAAKKKREKETNTNTSTNNPQGNNELKCQDEKGSDGGESGSSAYHDHDDDHHNPFNEGNDEEVDERDPPAAQPYATDAKSEEEVPSDVKIDEALGGKEDCVIMIERDLKSGESCESKNVSVAHVESAKESDYGNENSGGSLNDETVTEENSKDEPYNSVKETVTFDELVKSIDSSHAKMTMITENAPVGETGNSVVESPVDPVKAVASISEVKGSDTGNTLQEKSVASQVAATDLAMKINEDKVYTLSDENARTSSLEEPKPKEFDNKVSASVSPTPFPESTNGAEHVKDSDTPECSENQPLVTSAPSVVQKTSWLSCCGLFEVLTGSNG